MLRKILGVIVGVVAGVLTVSVLKMIGHHLVPPPPELIAALAEADRARADELIAQLPFAAFAMVLLAYLMGAFVATFTAAKIGREPRLTWLVGGIELAFVLANIVLIPHPAWFVAAAILATAIATIAGWKLSGGRLRGHGGIGRAASA